MIELRLYLEESGQSPFEEWFEGLEAQTAARLNTALSRLGAGNFSNVKGVGGGVFELKADFGPGYRIYFGKDGEKIVVLIGGGTKKKQQADIEIAKTRWADYKARKRKEIE